MPNPAWDPAFTIQINSNTIQAEESRHIGLSRLYRIYPPNEILLPCVLQFNRINAMLFHRIDQTMHIFQRN